MSIFPNFANLINSRHKLRNKFQLLCVSNLLRPDKIQKGASAGRWKTAEGAEVDYMIPPCFETNSELLIQLELLNCDWTTDSEADKFKELKSKHFDWHFCLKQDHTFYLSFFYTDKILRE